MARTFWEPAPEVATIAVRLIGDHHLHLAGVPIVYVFRSVAATSHGRVVLGKARRVTGLNAFLVALASGELDDVDDLEETDHTFFVMEIARDHWEPATDLQRKALVDHELCHFDVDDETRALRIRGHDLEEFRAVVARHGLWREDLEAFAGVCATVAD